VPGAPRGDEVTWVECPRDAWQGLPGVIPEARKRAHLEALLRAGFRHLDLGSFVSPRAVPQLADTERVLDGLTPPLGADLLCIVGNERGLERALSVPSVTSVGFPLSVNDTFQRRNLGRSLRDSWPLVARLLLGAEAAARELVVYLSMGFGNPYGEPWQPGDTSEAVARLRDMGVARIALADTVGRADAAAVAAVLAAVTRPAALGLHLHARANGWRPLLAVAVGAGVRWFEGALAGVGGCPFAGDALVGNLPSERVLPWLEAQSLRTSIDQDALPALAADAGDIAARYATSA